MTQGPGKTPVPRDCFDCPNLRPMKQQGVTGPIVWECKVLRLLRAECLVRGLMIAHENEAALEAADQNSCSLGVEAEP